MFSPSMKTEDRLQQGRRTNEGTDTYPVLVNALVTIIPVGEPDVRAISKTEVQAGLKESERLSTPQGFATVNL